MNDNENGCGTEMPNPLTPEPTAPTDPPKTGSGRMKRLLIAVCVSACWIALYFGIRFTLSAVISVIYTVIGMMHLGYEQVMNWVLTEKLGEISFIEIIISTVALFLTVFAFVVIRDNRKPSWQKVGFARDTGFVGFHPALIPVLLILGFFLNMLVSLLFSVLPIPEDLLKDYAQQSEVLNETSVLSVLATAIFAPLSEELVFRGLLISRLRKGMPLWLAALIPSLIFGLIHGQILWISYAFLLGVFLSFVCLRARSTAASTLLHASFNASSFLLPLLPIADDAPVTVLYALLATSAVISVAMSAALVLITRKKKTEKAECVPEASV